MQKLISTKDLYANFRHISEEVQSGTTFVVLKRSRPVYKIIPLESQESPVAIYTFQDIGQVVFESKNKEKNLAKNFKKYVYG